MRTVGRSPDNCARGPAEHCRATLWFLLLSFSRYIIVTIVTRTIAFVPEIVLHLTWVLMLGLSFNYTCDDLFCSVRTTTVKETD